MDDRRKDVGYKRPPVHTRFQAGRSGNPAGRPRRRPSFRATLLAELAEEDQLHVGTKLEALVKTLVDSAIAGNTRAQSVLIGELARIGDDFENTDAASVTPDEQEILDAYVNDELKRRANKTDASPKPRDGESE